MKPHKRNARGATVLELALAIFILGVTMPPLMMAFVEPSTKSIDSTQAGAAGFLAIERMEEIVARRYRATDGYDALTAANFPNEGAVAGFAGFARTVTISFVTSSLAASGSDQGYKLVRVTVTWNSGARQISLEHIFADHT